MQASDTWERCGTPHCGEMTDTARYHSASVAMARTAAIITAVVFWLCAQAASAGADYDVDPVYQAARTKMSQGKGAEVFPVIKAAAEAGYAKAQYNLAILYRDGLGTPASPVLYRRWMEAAAAQELPLALFTLGLDYDVGRGVAKDLPRALGYYERAAAAGDAKAAYNAGQINLMGEGSIPANPVQAIRFLEISANARDGKALMTLGWIYETGFTGLQDIHRSRDYYYRAEVAGMPAAADAIDRLKEVASRAAFDQMLAGKHAAAVVAFRQLCDEADMEACAYYGNYLANGAPGVPASVKAALVPLQKACDAGDMYGCQFEAYAVARAGIGRSVSESVGLRSASWFARRCGGTPKVAEACYNLAVMYYNRNIDGGRDKARAMAQEACEAAYKDGCRMVSAIDSWREHAARKAEENARKAEEFAARQQGGYRAGASASYGNSSSSSPSYPAATSTVNRAQDNADFNAFINKVNSYGTGYTASCRTGNPYC